jgi:hypothetical protein
MALVRSNAFAIRGMTPPPLPVPTPPRLLPISDPAAITWQGSVGASSYAVERAADPNGPWTVVGDGIDVSFVQYRPLFADENVPAGDWYYRVTARNDAGASQPSNIAGPVRARYDTLADELADLNKVKSVQGNIALKTNQSRAAKEDAHRAAGNSGDGLIYQLSTPIEGVRVFTFFPHDIADLKISISADGQNYQEIAADRSDYFRGTGDYGYWKPVLYHTDHVGGGGRFLKITMTGETQIGRVEITHDLIKTQAATP